LQACELLGRYLSIWKDRAALTDAAGTGPAVLEVHWKGSPQESVNRGSQPQEPPQRPPEGS
jgi:hypothetical protein